MESTLLSLKEALGQPFPVETIQFKPKDIHQAQGKYVCLALPFANKRIYEDRLNELVFGDWSSPYLPPYAQGNKLVIPATVVILGIAHTDYGEAFLTTTSKNGTIREDENTATEAYSQAFRRACAKFLVGRYLYDLPKLTLPYDPQSRQIAVSKGEKIAWVEKLYMERGLLPKVYATPTRLSVVPSRKAEAEQKSAGQDVPQTPSVLQPTSTLASHQQATPTTAYPNDIFLDWVCRCVNRDATRVADICQFYQVQHLEELNEGQRHNLTRRLQHQGAIPQSTTPSSSVVTASGHKGE